MKFPPGLEDIDPKVAGLLERYRFNVDAFVSLQQELRAGRFTGERNRVQGEVSPPRPDDLVEWPQGAARHDAEEIGRAALKNGEVGLVVLNGGMATRFGGVVKGVVEVLDGYSFLGLRIASAVQAEAPIPVFLMSSFATVEATQVHLVENDFFGARPNQVHNLAQRISLRLTPEGGLATDASGAPLPYAPGHGDVFEVLAESEAFRGFVQRGGKTLMVVNVDNLGATLSEVVIGLHRLAGRAVSVEVAPRHRGDQGGAPVRRGEKVEILEGFRFPEHFDHETLPVFNTNTLVLEAEAIVSDYPLTWFRADKVVDGQKVVQFERLMGEVTSFVESTYIMVPREGEDSRFMPVKEPQDLEALQKALRSHASYRNFFRGG